jgi:hypothetical protein
MQWPACHQLARGCQAHICHSSEYGPRGGVNGQLWDPDDRVAGRASRPGQDSRLLTILIDSKGAIRLLHAWQRPPPAVDAIGLPAAATGRWRSAPLVRLAAVVADLTTN